MEQECLYRIGDLADLSGVSPRTIDYYTQLGLLQACRRSEGNYRLYGAEALDRLKTIRAYREQGFHLSAIQDRLASRQNGDACSLQAHLEQLQALVEQMVQKSAEIAEVKAQLRAVAAEDQQARRALSQVASELLHKALVLSTALASALDGVGGPPAV